MVKLLIIFLIIVATTNVFSQQAGTIKDTVFIIDSFEQLPPKVQLVLLKQKPIYSSNHEICFTIKGCYLYKHQLFLPIGKIERTSNQFSDGCEQKFISLKGLLCSASGCITGLGSGDCKAMFINNKAVSININFVICNTQ